ncbi:hypothetical protein FRB90_003518, partial [Tulasnella sp. 427]
MLALPDLDNMVTDKYLEQPSGGAQPAHCIPCNLVQRWKSGSERVSDHYMGHS